ncbi:hypothetical protein [Pseudomonas nitroreducens]|uniref:hypothetical protein n=1 Tax=Pseudomonas nitroreducens TaxID=46680 RepID=UPI00055ABED0
MPRKTRNKQEDQAKPIAPSATQQVASADLQQKAPRLEYVQGQLAGVQLLDGTVVPLGDLPEADLRKIAEDMEIDGANSLSVEQLVAAIQDEPVLGLTTEEQAGADDAGSAEPPRIAGEDGRYQVLLTDGSLAFLEELETADLVALIHACLRHAPTGLAGAQFIGMDLAKNADVSIRGRGGFRYVVRRERLDHDDETYWRGEIIQFNDDEQASQLLAIGAIAPEIE